MTYRDVEYSDFGVVVELDGRFVHAGPRREWADLERDVDAVAGARPRCDSGGPTSSSPVGRSLLVGRLLRSRGWDGEPSVVRPTAAGPVDGVGRREWRMPWERVVESRGTTCRTNSTNRPLGAARRRLGSVRGWVG